MMPGLYARQPLIAILYPTGLDTAPAIQRLAALLLARNVRCAGFVQRNLERPGRSRCDMVLSDIASGRALPISVDRGPHAHACRLDEAELDRATSLAIDGLASRPDVLILNKFGKSESEGRGFRPLIAAALDAEIPVVVPVPVINAESWREFAGELSFECELEAVADLADTPFLHALGLTTTGRQRVDAVRAAQ